MSKLRFWYDFASTYSYPAAMRVEECAASGGIETVWCPFLLGPIFAAQGWRDSPFNIYPAKGAYMWRDLERVCAGRGLPFRRPTVFPQRSVLAARVALALAPAWRPAFSRAVYRAQFVDGADIAAVDVLEGQLRACGVEAADVLARANSEEGRSALRAATEEARELGIFGAPSFITEDGELFWGDDRLEQALDWAASRR